MRKARLNKTHALVGPKRLARLLAEHESREGLVDRFRNAHARARKIRRRDPHGDKRMYLFGRELEEIKTPYMRLEIARRRKANKVARASRKANR